MDILSNLYQELGFKNVKTYIQSGNVIFNHPENTTDKHEKNISAKIAEHFGFLTKVIVLTENTLNEIIRNNPFLSDNKKSTDFLHVTFLDKVPEVMNLNKISNLAFSPDEFIAIGKTIYLYCPNGYGKTKLNNTFFEKKLGVNATTRNWKTLLALQNLSVT